MLLFMIFGFSSFVFATDCFDSDDGQNFLVKGTTTGIFDETIGEIETVTDFCIDDTWVQEYYCGHPRNLNAIVTTSNNCPYGCDDGACIGSDKKKIIQCIDSDANDDKYLSGDFDTKGSVKIIYDDGTEDVLIDTCTQSLFLEPGVTDYVCGYANSGDGGQEPHYWKLTKTDCFCNDGACIDGPICSDSDGDDYFKKGIVSGLKTTNFNSKYELEDNCLDENQLQEYSCVGDVFSSKTYSCPFGCSNGVCLPYNLIEVPDEKDEIASAEGVLKNQKRVLEQTNL